MGPVTGGRPTTGRPSPGRTGRRPGPSDTRGQILAAARRQFATQGFDRTSIRAVAADAGVDPGLVLHYFGSKDSLFVAALDWPYDMEELQRLVVAESVEGLGERLVRFVVAQWEDESTRERLSAVVRSAVGHDVNATMTAEFIRRELIGRLGGLLPADQAQTRTSLIASTFIGLAIVRFIARIEPLASASPEALARAVGPTIQRYLTGDLD